jgi:lipopolysaccharide biosynthesis glycosyltransferase
MLKNFPFATINGVSSPGSATMSEAIMHVACAADENYIPHCATMLVSLFDRHDPACIHVHFLHSAGFPVKVLQQLGSMVQRHGAQISLHSIAEESTAGLPSIKDVAPVMWHKVLLPDLLPQLDKVLYLDTDIVITDELWPLWDTDFRGVSLAAVSNVMVPDQWGYPGRLGVAYADYFNTGVLLLNLQKMRGTDDARKILDASRGKD